jgi:hypothetical protein
LFSDKHAKLVIIGSGQPAHLQELRQITGFRGDLLTDPSRESYKILGFTGGISKVMGLKALSRGFSAWRAGYKPGTLQGDALQLGGAVIVNPDGTVAYYFASAEAGDHPPVAALLAAISTAY